jgi:hypothetical protein
VSGTTIPRKPGTVLQHIQTGVPWARTNVPVRVPPDDITDRMMRRIPRGVPQTMRDQIRLDFYRSQHTNAVPR